MAEVREQSPYFHKRPRIDRKASDSSYFVQSPSSAYGAVKSLGSWLVCLSANRGSPVACTNDRTDGSSCTACRPVIQEALRQFQGCFYFQKAWDSLHVQDKETSSGKECWKQTEARLHQCVRHLCSQRCYMRAYAPYRDWYALRQRIRTETKGSVEIALKGWSCCLLPRKNDEDSLPKTAFLDPEGNIYINQNQVMKHLLLNSDSQRRRLEEGDERMIQVRLFPASLQFSKKRLHRQQKEDKVSTGRQIQAQSRSTPFGLLEELFVHNPWQLLVSTIFLNRTTRVQVDAALYEFLKRWPSPISIVVEAGKHGDDDLCYDEICPVIQSLGMCHRRAAGIVRFSHDYLELLSRKVRESSLSSTGKGNNDDETTAARSFSQQEILGLFNCGQYAAAAYRLFIHGDLSGDPCDHALQAYTNFQRAAPWS